MKTISISLAVAAVFCGAACLVWMLDFWTAGVMLIASAILSVAVALYKLRTISRLTYGIVELVVSMGGAFYLVWTMVEKFATDRPTFFAILGPTVLALFTAMYFMVRALDNIGQGLSGEWDVRWKKIFEKPKDVVREISKPETIAALNDTDVAQRDKSNSVKELEQA